MSRLIDADALKRRLIKRREEIASERRYGWEWEYNGLNCAILLTGLEAVENPIRPEPHWIPVTEEPPEVGKSVLICDADGDICLGHRTNYGGYFPDFCEDKIKNVRAWMPLPEPYKEVI